MSDFPTTRFFQLPFPTTRIPKIILKKFDLIPYFEGYHGIAAKYHPIFEPKNIRRTDPVRRDPNFQRNYVEIRRCQWREYCSK